MIGIRKDPYAAYNFLVEIQGILTGGFTEVSGLNSEIMVDPKRFGGRNDIEYKFITGIKYPDLTLKRGLVDLDLLWNWYDEVTKGKIQRKTGTIYLRDHLGLPVMRWDFIDAYPIKWDGPTLNASSTTVATETLVLTHEGLSRAKAS